MIAAKGGASEPLNLGLPGKAGGAAAVRRTLASTICRIADPTLVARPRQLRDVSTVMRFQPAHQSMINRRHDGRASCLAWYSPKQTLERKPRIYAPATWKGGHESGGNVIVRKKTLEDNNYNLRKVVVYPGTGPFRSVRRVENEVWVMERNSSYWNKGLPYLDGVEFYHVLPFSPEM